LHTGLVIGRNMRAYDFLVLNITRFSIAEQIFRLLTYHTFCIVRLSYMGVVRRLVGSSFKMAIFWMCFHTFFVSTTSLISYKYQQI